MKINTLTPEEAMALINAQSNLIDELRARWLAITDIDNISNEDRLINGAWLALGSKPFSERFYTKALPVLQGTLGLYPEPVDSDALKSALIKVNGADWSKNESRNSR